MKIGITTPTGNVGSRLVNNLLKDGKHELVLIARDPSKLKDAESKGATLAKADLTDKDAVMEATKGLDTLFWVQPSQMNVDDFTDYYMTMAKNGVEAARKNNIKRVVLLSSIGAHRGDGLGPISALKKVEDIFKDSIKNLTIMRPTYFMENYLSVVPDIKDNGKIHLPVDGNARVPMVATEDIARVAADLVTREFTGQEIHSLHGPRDYTFAEAAEIIGNNVGKEVTHVRVTPERALQSMEQMGASRDVARQFVEMYAAIDKGRVDDEVPRSKETTTPTTLETFVKSDLAPAITG